MYFIPIRWSISTAGGVDTIHSIGVADTGDTVAIDEAGHDIYGDGEDDGAVVLGRDTVQSLEIPQLKYEEITEKTLQDIT